MENELFTCTWCEEEKSEDEQNDYDSEILCDECYAGVQECIDCKKKWTHAEIGTVADYDYYDKDGKYHCDDCGKYEGCCDECRKKVGKENLNFYESSWRNEKGYKQYETNYYCDECYEQYNPSIDPEEIAKSMTDDEEKQQEIIEAIENNQETQGTIWKQLTTATIEEKWEIVKIMGIARTRHEDTDYDELLQKGVDRDTARQIIKM